MRALAIFINILLAWLPALHGQVVISPVFAPETLVACGEPGCFKALLINSEGSALDNSEFIVHLPVGMNYRPGTTTGPLSEYDLSDVRRPVFLITSFPGASFQQVSFEVEIDCDFTNVAPLRYEVVANGQRFVVEEQPLGNYFYPEVVVIDTENEVLQLPVNGMGSRTFSIVQSTPGARLDTLFFVNQHGPGLAQAGLSAGTVVGSGPLADTVAIFGGDLPGGNGFFDYGDTLRLTEEVRLLQCAQQNSSIQLFWRCGEAVCQVFRLNTLVSPASGTPNLEVVNQSGFTTQVQANNPERVGGGFCETLTLTYAVTNSGSEVLPGAGAVYDLVLGLGLNGNLYTSDVPDDSSRFPAWSIRAEVNGQEVPMSAFAYPDGDPLLGYNLRFDDFESDPDGPGGLSDLNGDGRFGELPVGASFELQVHIDYDPEAVVNCQFLSGFPTGGGSETVLRVGYHYRNQCRLPYEDWYSVTDPGINVVSLFTHRAGDFNLELESANLAEGQEVWLDIWPSGAWRSPCAGRDSFILEVVLPPGLMATGASNGPAPHHGIVGQSGDTIWLSSGGRGSAGQPWRLRVRADCDADLEVNFLQLSFLYFCSSDCPYYRRIDCQAVPLAFLTQCDPPVQGLSTKAFSVERRSLGWQNVQHTVKVDPSLDPSINLQAAINFDSVEMRLSGLYRGQPPFGQLYARMAYHTVDSALVDPASPHFFPLGAQLQYFPASGGQYDCTLSEFESTYDAAGNRHYITTALEALFAPGGCLEAIDRQDGDSLSFSLFVLVTSNTPIRASPVPTLTGEFFAVLNGQEVSGNRYLAPFVLERVVPDAYVQYTPRVHYGCEQVRFNSNAVTNKGHTFDGDQFPNEIRSVATVSAIRVRLQGRWALVPGSSQVTAAGSWNENGGLSATAIGTSVPIGDPEVVYEADSTLFIYTNPGNWPKGDLAIGGSNAVHDIHFSALPNCGLPEQGSFGISVEADMVRYPYAPMAWRDTLVGVDISSAKQHRAQQAELLLSSVQSFIPVSDTVAWQFRIENTTNYTGQDKDIPFGWINVDVGADIELLRLADISNPNAPVLYTPTFSDTGSYWFAIGELSVLGIRQFELVGLYEDCEPQSLSLRYLFSCAENLGEDYFLSGAYQACHLVEQALFVQPANISLALNVGSPAVYNDLCTELDYSLLVTNLQLPNAYQNTVAATLPPGAQIVPGSSRMEYPAGSGNWIGLADPDSAPGNRWAWDFTQTPQAPEWIRGVANAPANQYRLAFRILTDCSLTAGLRLGFQVSAANSCGTVINRSVFSRRLLINGLPAYNNTYRLDVQLPDGGLKACGTSTLRASVLNLGPFATTDIEFAQAQVPAQFDLLPGSLPPGISLASSESDGLNRRLRFALPPGLPPGDSLVFQFQLWEPGLAPLDCDTLAVSLGMLLEAEARCESLPEGYCDILVALNADTLSAPVLKDDWTFEILAWESQPANPDGEAITAVVQVSNHSPLPVETDSLRWAIYYDSDGDGLLDLASDSLLLLLQRGLPRLPGFGVYRDTFSFYVATDYVCPLLLAVQHLGESCFCEPLAAVPAPVPTLRNAGSPEPVCSGREVVLGEDFRQEGVVYEWTALSGTGGQLSDETVPMPTFTAENLTDGTQVYTYELSSIRGGQCRSQDTVQITVWPQPVLSAAASSNYNGYDISCHGQADGGVLLDLQIGASPAVYTWAEQSQGSPAFTGLSAGEHQFAVVDARGCEGETSLTLSEPPPLALSVSASDASCFGGSDGQAAATATGGVQPYAYNWSAGEAQDSLTIGLAAGSISLSLTDANGCGIMATAIVRTPAPITYELNLDSTACAYSADGQAALESLQGGTPPYAIAWDGTSGAMAISTLDTGWHVLALLDAQGCELADTFFIPGPAPIDLASAQQENASCFGLADGRLSVVAQGGVGGYRYEWSNGASGPTAEGLMAGGYAVSVTDTYDCVYVFDTFEILSPERLVLSLIAHQGVSCFGYADGTLQVGAQGGTAPYEYEWQTGETGPQRHGLEAGDYAMSVTDAQGCTDSLALMVGTPQPLSLSYELDPPGCSGQDGFLYLSAAGGMPPYGFAAGDGPFSADGLIRLPEGRHLIQLRDANNCWLEMEVDMPAPPPLELQLPEELRVNYGDTLSVLAEVFGASGELWVDWQPDWAGISCTDCLNPWFSLEESTVFYLEVVDDNGCSAKSRLSIIVEKPRRVFIPSAFSPNGDGRNDYFFPHAGPEVVQVNAMEVYDRWGNQVFRNTDFLPGQAAQGWDGQIRGQPAGIGLYVYWMEVAFLDGEVLRFEGEVNLIR